MGIPSESSTIPPNVHEILAVLANAEKLFWSDLELVANRGKAFHVRDAAISLAFIRAFKASLGEVQEPGPTLAARLLGE